MKRLLLKSIVLLLMSILINGCTFTKSHQEPPEVKITIEGKQMGLIISKNQWNGVKYDREDTLKTILNNGLERVPYINVGSTATVSFSNNPPNKLTVSDILIDNNGNPIYTQNEIVNIPVELKDGKCSFQIIKHFASSLSSYYVESKMNIRALKMTASWGENECEYTFIIRTN